MLWKKVILASALLPSVAMAEAPVADLSPPPEVLYAGNERVGSGTGEEIPEREYAGTVKVLDGDFLRERGYLYLGDAVAEQAGVYVEYLPGSEGPTMIPRIRGGNGRDVLILIDGVPVNNVAAAWAELRAVPLELVRKVEVLAGPAGSRYGNRAAGGVINVYTLRGPLEAARTLLSASDGSFNSERYRFNFGITAGAFDIFASGNRRLSLEPNTHTGSNKNASANVDGAVTYRWRRGEVRVGGGHYAGYDAVLEPFTWETVVTSPSRDAPARKDYAYDRVNVEARAPWGDGSTHWRVYYITGAGSFENYETRRSYQYRGREAAAAAAYLRPHGDGGVFKLDVGGGIRGNVDAGEEGYFAEGRCVEEYRFAAPVRAHAGAAYGLTPEGGVVTPCAGVCAFPWSQWKVYAAADGGTLFPAPGEVGRYATLPSENGGEAGTRVYFPGDAEAGLAFYYSRGTHRYVEGWGWTEELNRSGLEASASGDVEKWFDWYASYCYARGQDGDDRESPFVPRHRGFAKVGREQRFFHDDLRVRLEGRLEYCGERLREDGPFENAVPFPQPGLKIPYRDALPPYWQVGGHFSFAILTLEAYCNVENINRARDYVVRPAYAVPRRVRTFVGFNWTLLD